MLATALDIPLTTKVPALVALVVAEYVAFIPPNKAPNKDEHSRYGGKDDFLDISAAWLPYIGVTVLWFLHFIELSAIFSQTLPSSLSSAILSALFFGPASGHRLSATPLFLLGSLLLVAGAAIRKACYVHLGRQFTFELSVFKEHKLVTTGPYAVVRHPSYTGLILNIAGLMLVHLAPGAYVAECGLLDAWAGRVVVCFAILLGVYLQAQVVGRTSREDGMMKQQFGQAWEEWAQRTPCKLVPYVY